jgi:autotransporter-associated beta strand protein
VVTENSTVTAVNVKFQNGGAADVASGKTLNFTGTITDSSSGGASALVKLGDGTLTLNSAGDAYTGATTVNAGVLELAAATTLTGSTNVSAAGSGTLHLTTNTGLSVNTTLTIASGGAKVDIDSGRNQTVKRLYLGPRPMWVGTWGHTGSPATYQSAVYDSYFGGTGMITVTEGAPHEAMLFKFM